MLQFFIQRVANMAVIVMADDKGKTGEKLRQKLKKKRVYPAIILVIKN